MRVCLLLPKLISQIIVIVISVMKLFVSSWRKYHLLLLLYFPNQFPAPWFLTSSSASKSSESLKDIEKRRRKGESWKTAAVAVTTIRWRRDFRSDDGRNHPVTVVKPASVTAEEKQFPLCIPGSCTYFLYLRVLTVWLWQTIVATVTAMKVSSPVTVVALVAIITTVGTTSIMILIVTNQNVLVGVSTKILVIQWVAIPDIGIRWRVVMDTYRGLYRRRNPSLIVMLCGIWIHGYHLFNKGRQKYKNGIITSPAVHQYLTLYYPIKWWASTTMLQM